MTDLSIAETYCLCLFIGKGVIMAIEEKRRLAKSQDADVSSSMFVYACEFTAAPDNTEEKKPKVNPLRCGSGCSCQNIHFCPRD
jgi:hypothetical protein